MNLLTRYLLLTLALATPLDAYSKPPSASAKPLTTTAGDPSAAATSMLHVMCEGDDTGAEVSINGKFKGECPVNIQVSSGTLTLRVEKKNTSYERVFEQEIRMGDGVVKRVDAVLSRSLNVVVQRRLHEEATLHEAEKVRRLTEVEAQIAANMIRIPDQHYELGKTEVTQGQWKAVMDNNPSSFKSCSSNTSNCNDNNPVESVSWNDAQEFIQKLNAKTGKQYRLPTEAEWEYACYGGTKTEYCGGKDIDAVGWYDKNSGNVTHPVGQKQANGFGLYDMSGNVWEWMQDCNDKSCGGREIRGGSWYFIAGSSRPAYRFNIDPSTRIGIVGFRLARTLR